MASRRPRIKGIADIPSRKRHGEDSGKPPEEVKFEETELVQESPKEAPPSNIIVLKKSTDSDYPVPPQSPSKLNRNRIKATPQLGSRKPSIASESEDEGKKYGRIRNNSVCSVASTTCQEPPTPTSETFPAKDPLKKSFRTEQSRKLAEARREFHKKFGTNMPDKQKLKMIDLIFYNPVTNPMSQTRPENKINLVQEASDVEESEPEPEPAEKENDDSNNTGPVPQIKIGPTGEIILDEKSLLVENAELTKQKEKLRKSKLVDGDFDTSYGVYKKVPRSLPWTQKETLRFYKALNLIGTDFSVMTQLFPKRTRRELKIKFKKEEKNNRQLIDKAITQPCNYNFSDLKRELQIEQEEEAFLLKLKRDELLKAKEDREEKRKKKRKAAKEPTLPEDSEDSPMLPFKKRLTKIDGPKSKTGINIQSVLDDDDYFAQSESEEEEFISLTKPTRSGRMSKSTVHFTEPVKVVPSNIPRNSRLSSTSSIDSSAGLIPGAVVITSEENSREYRGFMVTPDRKLTPLPLASEVMARVIEEKLNGEENVTIPAVEEKVQ